MDIKIYTPSYKRAGESRAFNYFGTDLVYCVHKFEQDLYEKAYPDNEILVLSDESRGNMSKVRNEIMNKRQSDNIVMIDDDVQSIKYMEKLKRNLLEDYNWLFKRGFIMARDMGVRMWGINIIDSRFGYRGCCPVSMLTPVIGSFCCFRMKNNNIRYDERLSLNEDYDYWLQVMHQDHKILRLNKYHYLAEHWDRPGGCGSYRTIKEEKEQSKIMLKKWGRDCIKYNFKRGLHPSVNVPIRGV